MMRILALLLCLIHSCTPTSLKIFISKHGLDCPLCLEGQYSCKTLEYVANHNISNTVIRINYTNYTLSRVVQFNGVHNVTITGETFLVTLISCKEINNSEAGLVFYNSSNIKFTEFIISNCWVFLQNAMVRNLQEKLSSNLTNILGNASAILFLRCCEVFMEKVNVTKSHGYGLTLIETVQVNITHCSFINNKIPESNQGWQGGGGLQILLLESHHSFYNLSHNNFLNNMANISFFQENFFHTQFSNRGSGMKVLLFNNCKNIEILLCNNSFVANTAIFGGGLMVYIGDNSSNNTIHIAKNRFSNNNATIGGGANIGFSKRHNSNFAPFMNQITINDGNMFANNTAKQYGGGIVVFSATANFNSMNYSNKVEFETCHFHGNRAQGGAAVTANVDIFKNIGREYLVTVIFKNCFFINNTSNENGAVFINILAVQFEGNIIFLNNSQTALYAASAQVTIKNGSFLNFSFNNGYHGGAILLTGNFPLRIEQNNTLHFHNNTALYQGGAICALMEELVVRSLESCFLQVMTNDVNTRSIEFHFYGNTASVGKDIFMNTLSQCKDICQNKYTQPIHDEDLFNPKCFAAFNFSDNTSYSNQVATTPKYINVSSAAQKSLHQMIPGWEHEIVFNVIDELCNRVNDVFHLTVALITPNVNITNKLDYNKITIFGDRHLNGSFFLISQKVKITVNFTLLGCPPGYHIQQKHCKCSQNYSNTHVHCGYNQVLITVGYWIGCLTNNCSEDELFTGVCLSQMCGKNPEHGRYNLSKTIADLEGAVCGDTRKGRLCGACIGNLTVYYNSADYSCQNCSSCKYGPALYILVELAPVTVFFLTILLFNINLTSGALYSFVFYAQIISMYPVNAFNSLEIRNSAIKNVLKAIYIFYGNFNLNLIGSLCPFCIFETKSIIPLFLINYLTNLYALFLVLGTMLILKIHSCYSCVKMCRRCGRRNIRGSIVDGLSAFIVICYSQFAYTTSRILIPSVLYDHNMARNITVALYDGELTYLQGKHWYYAVPAFLCIILILIPPPLILILEPPLTKLFSIDFFAGTVFRWYYNKLRLKLMPFLDSFQACFKDKYRYFAGFYFVYRLLATFRALIPHNINGYYMEEELILIIILFIHTAVQPYKDRKHSILELFLLVNLLLVLIITSINYGTAIYDDPITEDFPNQKQLKTMLIFQTFLLCLPIMYLLCYTGFAIYKRLPVKLLQHFKKFKLSNAMTEVTETTNIDMDFPARLIDSDSVTYGTF